MFKKPNRSTGDVYISSPLRAYGVDSTLNLTITATEYYYGNPGKSTNASFSITIKVPEDEESKSTVWGRIVFVAIPIIAFLFLCVAMKAFMKRDTRSKKEMGKRRNKNEKGKLTLDNSGPSAPLSALPESAGFEASREDLEKLGFDIYKGTPSVTISEPDAEKEKIEQFNVLNLIGAQSVVAEESTHKGNVKKEEPIPAVLPAPTPADIEQNTAKNERLAFSVQHLNGTPSATVVVNIEDDNKENTETMAFFNNSLPANPLLSTTAQENQEENGKHGIEHGSPI